MVGPAARQKHVCAAPHFLAVPPANGRLSERVKREWRSDGGTRRAAICRAAGPTIRAPLPFHTLRQTPIRRGNSEKMRRSADVFLPRGGSHHPSATPVSHAPTNAHSQGEQRENEAQRRRVFAARRVPLSERHSRFTRSDKRPFAGGTARK